MIQFLIHEKEDNVGVATVDINAGETAKELYMDSQMGVKKRAATPEAAEQFMALFDRYAAMIDRNKTDDLFRKPAHQG